MIRAVPIFVFLATSAAAQLLGDRQTLDCASLVEGRMIDSSIEIICGIPAEQMTEMMRLAVSGRPEDYSALLARLEDLTPDGARLKADSIRSFFQILKHNDVPEDQLTDRLAEIARRHLELQSQLATLQVADPDIQSLIEAAATALAADPPDHNVARARLAAALALRREKREAAQSLLDEQSREEARILRSQANLEASLLNRLAAAALYQEAAAALPQDDEDRRRSDLYNAANLLYDQGLYRGGNDALRRAIDLYGDVLVLTDRGVQPINWAQTQRDLGDALLKLEQLQTANKYLRIVDVLIPEFPSTAYDDIPENGLQTSENELPETDLIKGAIKAYQNAQKIWTRDSMPLDWATTEASLGDAFVSLGARDWDLDMIQKAIIHYRSALQVQTRDTAPVDRANTQHSLSTSLMVLGVIGVCTDCLEEAGETMDSALREQAPDPSSLEWLTFTTTAHVVNALVLADSGEIELATKSLDDAEKSAKLMEKFAEERTETDIGALISVARFTIMWIGMQD